MHTPYYHRNIMIFQISFIRDLMFYHCSMFAKESVVVISTLQSFTTHSGYVNFHKTPYMSKHLCILIYFCGTYNVQSYSGNLMVCNHMMPAKRNWQELHPLSSELAPNMSHSVSNHGHLGKEDLVSSSMTASIYMFDGLLA